MAASYARPHVVQKVSACDRESSTSFEARSYLDATAAKEVGGAMNGILESMPAE
jgi:hypothetical protein